jgi:hypothetical protein
VAVEKSRKRQGIDNQDIRPGDASAQVLVPAKCFARPLFDAGIRLGIGNRPGDVSQPAVAGSNLFPVVVRFRPNRKPAGALFRVGRP